MPSSKDGATARRGGTTKKKRFLQLLPQELSRCRSVGGRARRRLHLW